MHDVLVLLLTRRVARHARTLFFSVHNRRDNSSRQGRKLQIHGQICHRHGRVGGSLIRFAIGSVVDCQCFDTFSDWRIDSNERDSVMVLEGGFVS